MEQRTSIEELGELINTIRELSCRLSIENRLYPEIDEFKDRSIVEIVNENFDQLNERAQNYKYSKFIMTGGDNINEYGNLSYFIGWLSEKRILPYNLCLIVKYYNDAVEEGNIHASVDLEKILSRDLFSSGDYRERRVVRDRLIQLNKIGSDVGFGISSYNLGWLYRHEFYDQKYYLPSDREIKFIKMMEYYTDTIFGRHNFFERAKISNKQRKLSPISIINTEFNLLIDSGICTINFDYLNEMQRYFILAGKQGYADSYSIVAKMYTRQIPIANYPKTFLYYEIASFYDNISETSELHVALKVTPYIITSRDYNMNYSEEQQLYNEKREIGDRILYDTVNSQEFIDFYLSTKDDDLYDDSIISELFSSRPIQLEDIKRDKNIFFSIALKVIEFI